MPEAVSYDQSREMLKAKVLAATQAAHALPAPGDMDFHRTLHRQFSTDLDAASSHLLSLTSNLLHLVNDKTGELQEETILDEHSFDAKVVETVDGLLELVDGFVEEHKYGKNKSAVTQQLEGSQQHQQSPQANQQQTAQPPVASSVSAHSASFHLSHLKILIFFFGSRVRPNWIQTWSTPKTWPSLN